MRLAFTFDLKSAWLARGLDEEAAAEFDSPVTIEAIAGHFSTRGFQVDRVGGVHELLPRLAAGERWDLALNICEGHLGSAREALVPALLEHAGIPTLFSDAAVLALCLRKDFSKRVVRDAGVPTADFLLVESLADLNDLTLPFPVFAKPVAEGTGKGVGLVSRCTTAASLRRVAQGLLEKFRQPVLVETWLPGREFTVGIVGQGAAAQPVGCIEVSANAKAPLAYGFVEKQEYRARVTYTLATDDVARQAVQVALASWRALGCRDGGRVDVRCDANGQPCFIEANPLAGLNPEDSDLVIMARLQGHTPAWLYDRIMQAALSRLALPWPTRIAA
jgi:D-alanine-D-alanine ligase